MTIDDAKVRYGSRLSCMLCGITAVGQSNNACVYLVVSRKQGE